MPLPPSFEGRLRLPVIAAPMFLASGPEMVLACCRAGIVGSFPAKNRRTREGLDEWLTVIGEGLAAIEARTCLLYTSPSPRDGLLSRMPSSA